MRKRINLALALILLALPQEAYALSCSNSSLEQYLKGADAVFEGSLLKVERKFEITEKGDLGSHYERFTLTVDKNWKGSKEGETITVIAEVWMPLQEGVKDWPEKTGEKENGIFALYKASEDFLKQHGIKKEVYFVGMCGQLMWEATLENLNLVQKTMTDLPQ